MKQVILATLGTIVVGTSGTALADHNRHGDRAESRHGEQHERAHERHHGEHDRALDRHDEFHDAQDMERADDYYWYGDDGWFFGQNEAQRAWDHQRFHHREQRRHRREHRRAAIGHRWQHRDTYWRGWQRRPMRR